ncbi:MAG: TRAP transporter substrate-binding protein [Hyphomicrobiaceae bacterium]
MIRLLDQFSAWSSPPALARSLVAGFAAVLMLAPVVARAETTFTIHHFLSPKALTHEKFLEPWAERVRQQSQGRLRFEIFPSMTLGGAPPDLYRQVRDGTADLVWTLAGYTPGVFPRLEVFELFGVHGASAKATSLAIQDLLPELAPDLAEVHPVLVHVHGGNALHLVDRQVGTLADIRGLKLRSPSRTGVWMLEAFGAEPVGMPVPALPQALSAGTIDGALIPFEVAIPLRIAQFAKHSVELDGGRRFGTSVFLFLMNKARYEALPADLRAIIDANSGSAIVSEVAAAWDEMEPMGIKVARDAGRTVTRLDVERSAAFDAAAEAVQARWVGEAKAKGIDAAGLLARAKERIATHSAGP